MDMLLLRRLRGLRGALVLIDVVGRRNDAAAGEGSSDGAGEEQVKIVAVDLQDMAPLPGVVRDTPLGMMMMMIWT